MSIFAVDKDGNRRKIAGTGLPGPAGKSAYQYAVEGGFVGTEDEFRAIMGGAIPTCWIIRILGSIRSSRRSMTNTTAIQLTAGGWNSRKGGANSTLSVLALS